MSFKYKSVVPWGRSFPEYIDMFGLSVPDLDKKILGCGDGPASFNCVMKQKGKTVISVDPIYEFTKEEIEKRIDETFHDVIGQTRKNQDKFNWSKIENVDELGKVRMSAMKDFINDYETGKKENRYICAELPVLPFADDKFDLALSSHFLFLHSDHLSLGFHLQSIDEMLRVSREVRIFPLLDVNGIRPDFVDTVIGQYIKKKYFADELKVNYEFQKGGNTMLKIERNK
jgi:hypothetical protein